MIKFITAALFVLVQACTPAKSPTVLDAATVAVNAVDAALSVYIDVVPINDAGAYPELEPLVVKVEHAAAIVRSAGDVCAVLPDLEKVSEAIGCTKCKPALEAAKEQLKCQ
jgi:hypothetical protein